MIDSIIHGEYPVVYEAPKPKKIIPTENDLYTFDKFAMGSIIGQITNKGASAYALLPILEKKYGKDSNEYQMTLCRLKQSCKAQSAQIDKSKIGREVKGIPNDWMVVPSEDKLDTRDLTYTEYKHILLNRRPYFFKYLYRDSKKDYKKYQDKQETLCIKMFGKPLDTVLNSLSPTEEEKKFVEEYYEWSPLIDSDSCMNVLCKYIESVDFEIKDKIKTKENFAIYRIYKNLGVSYSVNQEQLALKALQEYKQLKAKEQINKNYNGIYLDNREETNIASINLEEIALKYINNIDTLTNIYVDYFYETCPKSNKDILWKYFGKNIVKNIIENTKEPIMFPLKDTNGNIEYLGKTYSLKEIKINEQ